MKNLKELNGVKVLSKNEQKLIKGGAACGDFNDYTCNGDNSFCCLKTPWAGYCRQEGDHC
jgi:hypothetical protein